MQKKVNKFLIIPNDNNLSAISCTSFILPLKDFSVGFEHYFDVDEINQYALHYEVSIIINKFLHSEDIKSIKGIISKLNNIKYYFIEDFGLTSIIPKEKIVLYPIHIISNIESINYLYDIGYKNVLISNELTIDEIKEIDNKSISTIFYVYTGRNNIMYSKRELLTNYYDNFNIKNKNKYVLMSECASLYNLRFREEYKSTTVFDDKIFCASKYLKELKNFNLIINLNNISKVEKETVLNNIENENLCDLLDTNNRFLEEKIIYKVGDMK